MNDKTAELIEKLAERLGTTAEHLWEVLVRQAPITATTDTITLGLMLVAGLVAFWLAVRWAKHPPYESGDANEFAIVVAGIAATVLLLIVAISFVASASDIVSGFANPEYWALKQLLK